MTTQNRTIKWKNLLKTYELSQNIWWHHIKTQKTQNGTPGCKNHIKTYEGILKQMMTQNGTLECNNHIKICDNTKWEPRVQEPYKNMWWHKMGPQSARTINKHMTIQNRTPEYKNHIKTYDNTISKHMTTQNGTPECKNHVKNMTINNGTPECKNPIKLYDESKWVDRVQAQYQKLWRHKMGAINLVEALMGHWMGHQL